MTVKLIDNKTPLPSGHLPKGKNWGCTINI